MKMLCVGLVCALVGCKRAETRVSLHVVNDGNQPLNRVNVLNERYRDKYSGEFSNIGIGSRSDYFGFLLGEAGDRISVEWSHSDGKSVLTNTFSVPELGNESPKLPSLTLTFSDDAMAVSFEGRR